MELLEGDLAVADADELVDTLDAVGERHGCAVQAVDARLIAGRTHLESAVDHANRAFRRDETIARDRSVEILLYAAGRRQISRALALGVDEGTGPAVIVADAEQRVEAGAARSGADGAGGDDAGAPAAERAACDALRERLAIDERPTLDATDEAAVRAYFDVGEAERAATDAPLARLVCERVALLAVER